MCSCERAEKEQSLREGVCDTTHSAYVQRSNDDEMTQSNWMSGNSKYSGVWFNNRLIRGGRRKRGLTSVVCLSMLKNLLYDYVATAHTHTYAHLTRPLMFNVSVRIFELAVRVKSDEHSIKRSCPSNLPTCLNLVTDGSQSNRTMRSCFISHSFLATSNSIEAVKAAERK